VLGTDEPLRHRLLRNEEGARNLIRAQPTEGAQGERDLRLERERGVAAGEEELQALIGDRCLHLDLVLNGFRDIQQAGLFLELPVAADPIDRPVASGRDEPGARVVRDPVLGPALGCDRERLLSGLLGEVEAAEEADQAGEDAAPLLPEDLVEDP
jgi:hypothetical protein